MRAKLLYPFGHYKKGKVGELVLREDGLWFLPLGAWDWIAVYSEEIAVRSFDGMTWADRPLNTLFKAGETYYTIPFWEAVYQRRLL